MNSPHDLGDRDGWYADRIPIVVENVEKYDSWKDLYEEHKSRFGISDASPNEAKRCWELLKE